MRTIRLGVFVARRAQNGRSLAKRALAAAPAPTCARAGPEPGEWLQPRALRPLASPLGARTCPTAATRPSAAVELILRMLDSCKAHLGPKLASSLYHSCSLACAAPRE